MNYGILHYTFFECLYGLYADVVFGDIVLANFKIKNMNFNDILTVFFFFDGGGV